MSKSADELNRKVSLYNLKWPALMHPVAIEMEMIRHGGQYKKANGQIAGLGLFEHCKRLQDLVWPEEKWHRWRILTLKTFCEQFEQKAGPTGIMGAASSGKTHDAAMFGLTIYYTFSDCCTVLCTSTEREALEMRILGELKALHKRAKARFENEPINFPPGQLIESRQRILTDERGLNSDGRDFRNGVVGVPTKRGGQYVGMGSFVGIKNKIVILLADEGSLMPRVYIDSMANLDSNPRFLAIVMGNPKETTDALGIICEPSEQLGGWTSGLDQGPKTKTWKTRLGGTCIQLCGTDSPNFDAGPDEPVPFPFLITPSKIEKTAKDFGKDSWQFQMMCMAMMPRGQGSHRVITRELCRRFEAMEEPVWKDTNRTNIVGLDAALGGEGGDRSVLTHVQYGVGFNQDQQEGVILALIASIVVPVTPITVEQPLLPDDQIALFCKNYCESNNVPPENFFFDSTGRGMLANAFARGWSAQVEPVEFGGKPSERAVSNEIPVMCRDYYSKFVSELWYSIRLCIESRQFRGMTEEVMQEGCMREWKLVTGNKVEVETKADMKMKMGRSPDLFDSLACAVEGARRRGFVIKKISSVYRPQTDQWKSDLRKKSQALKQHRQMSYARS